MIHFRLPNLTDGSEKQQLHQLKSYLYQLVQELNWAFEMLEKQEQDV